MRLPLSVLGLCAVMFLMVPASATGKPLPNSGRGPSQNTLPLVADLNRLTRDNWARVAGSDTNLPPRINGHDEFAAAWTREILASLHGLPVTVFRQPFAVPGFKGQAPSKPGINVVVAVPGSRRPNQAVIVGAHYDGEPFSRGSVYDDASGCVIALALARDLGSVWRAHGLPSLTVEFVLFDAEEQGLVGSLSYALDYRHSALLPRSVLMIDEEQSGVGYPVRPFGLLSGRPIPSYADTSARVPQFVSHPLGGAQPPPKAVASLLLQRLEAARDISFRRLRRVYPTLPYRGGRAPAFTDSDRAYFLAGSLSICCSDNDPFAAIGIPTVTFGGDSEYYARDVRDWSYPFDQPQDTLTSLACDTSGSPTPGPALEAALELPLELSRVLVMDYAPPATGKSDVLFSTQPSAGQAAQFTEAGAGHVRWSFGDGGKALGAQVQHVYSSPGRYLLTVHTDLGTETRSLQVLPSPLPSGQPVPLHPPHIKPWHPSELTGVTGCP